MSSGRACYQLKNFLIDKFQNQHFTDSGTSYFTHRQLAKTKKQKQKTIQDQSDPLPTAKIILYFISFLSLFLGGGRVGGGGGLSFISLFLRSASAFHAVCRLFQELSMQNEFLPTLNPVANAGC